MSNKKEEIPCEDCVYAYDNRASHCPYCNPPDWKMWKKGGRRVVETSGAMWRRLNQCKCDKCRH